MTQYYLPSSEELGRRRFKDDKSSRKAVRDLAQQRLIEMRSLLASNYPQDPFSSNLALFHRMVARELARIQISDNAINSDARYTTTRPEYLHQILGERLFLGNRIAPAGYNDESYRQFLTSIKSTYLKGSKVENIEALASTFTGQSVIIKELYKELRKAGTSLDISYTNMMVVEAFIADSLPAGYNIASLLSDLNFYINLVRPAHVLYDTKLIWTEIIDVNKTTDVYFGDTGGGCVPIYLYNPFEETTLMALQIFILPDGQGATGLIDSIHHWDLLFYLDDSTRVLAEPGVNGTRIYDVNGRQVSFSALEIGQYVRINYQIIPGSFQFWYPVDELLPTWSSQFYRDVYRRPLFQEFVKKQMDSKGRFPLQIRTTETTVCDRWVQDTLQPYYEDIRRNCALGSEHAIEYTETLRQRMGSSHFSNPYGTQQSALPGNEFCFFMEHTPLTDGSSNPATVSDISVLLDGTSLPLQPIVYVDASYGKIQLTESVPYWDDTAQRFPVAGNEFQFDYHYLYDSTNYDASTVMVFGIGSWQMPKAPMVNGDSSGILADSSDVSVSVDGTVITNVVTDINALLGHIRLNQLTDFWNNSELGRLPRIGDTFEFDYYYGLKYEYSCLFDELGRTFDTYVGYGSTYGIVFDGELDKNPEIYPIVQDSTAIIGYRYRGYLLHHSSVLNSPDTLRLNTFQKPATRASIINQAHTINHFNIFFSPEFLYDTNPIEVLDDAYLENGLDPILKLNKGTPPFQKSWSHHPGLVYSRKLQDIRTNRRLLLYSDLLLKEFQEGNENITLSPLCDSEKTDIRIHYDGDTIPPLEECPPWILFDTVQVDNITVWITGIYRGVPNLRVADKKLRQNFILRELELTNVAQYTYTFNTARSAIHQTEYYLPSSFQYTYNDQTVTFPALPVIDLDGNPATIDDIEVRINGILWTVTSFNPVTGYIVLQDWADGPTLQTSYTITAEDVLNKMIRVSAYPTDPRKTTFTITHGINVYTEVDFFILDENLRIYDGISDVEFWYISWNGGPLNDVFTAGDPVVFSYVINVNAEVTVETKYYITNGISIPMINREYSRIFDDDDVFAGYCSDGFQMQLDILYREYLLSLDDSCDGIKLVFFNKDTLTIEEHVFSGPVFEYYSAEDDEIASRDNFPQALVRIVNPLHLSDPLHYTGDYGFLDAELVRFRKKTFKELLADNTFRTLELIEMLPV